MAEQILTTFVALFVIIDPIGTIPLFISLTANLSAADRMRVARKAIIVSGGVLLGFILLGKILFDAIGVRLLSFEIAGGIVLFLFGLKMIFDKPEGMDMSAELNHDVAVFPLAVPAIAGPGAMLGVTVYANLPGAGLREQGQVIVILGVVLALTYLMMRVANRIQKYLGNTGALILSRVMGILLTAIATETILKALAKLPWFTEKTGALGI